MFSIITTNEVKGNITLSMKNVPWTKALDTILDINSLTKTQEDNVIIVTTLSRSKADDAARERSNRQRKKEGRLKKVY